MYKTGKSGNRTRGMKGKVGRLLGHVMQSVPGNPLRRAWRGFDPHHSMMVDTLSNQLTMQANIHMRVLQFIPSIEIRSKVLTMAEMLEVPAWDDGGLVSFSIVSDEELNKVDLVLEAVGASR